MSPCFKGENLPVENVSWENCHEFINQLNTLTEEDTKIKNMIKDFKNFSGDGFEVVNANSSREEISLGNQWSKDHDLLASCGSDFHGWPNQRVQIGNLLELPNPKRAVWRHI